MDAQPAMAGFPLPHMLYDGRWFTRPGFPLPHEMMSATSQLGSPSPSSAMAPRAPPAQRQQQQRGIRRRSRAPAVPFYWPYAPPVDADATASDSDDEDEEEDEGLFGAVAASERAIEELRKTTAGEAREQGCSVCMEDYFEAEEERIRAMPCGHSFHQRCFFEWLELSCVCPLCRFALPTHQEDDHALAS